MELKMGILMALIFYYAFMTLFILNISSVYADSFTVTGSSQSGINASSLNPSEISTAGVFASGISFTRFAGMITFGVGLPGSAPDWFKVLFGVWQSALFLFSIAFIVDSIWSG